MNAFKCHRARVNFELYLDGALSPEECEVLEQHLFECSACASAVGDDIQLGEALGTVGDSGSVPVVPATQVRSWPRVRAAAAAVVLMVGGAAIGHLATRETSKPSEAGGRDLVAGGPTSDLVPLTELVDEPEVGFASFTDSEVFEAEREGLRSRAGQSEFRARRIEAELELVRPLLEETATPERVIERLQDRVRQMPASPPPPRSPRDDRDRMRGGGPFHHVHVAMSLLRRNPQAAFEPAVAWLKTARTPFERQCAVKLIAALRVPQAHDVLVAETREGPARDVALDGLVVLRDPRSQELFASMLDDEKESNRIKAAGGLHRLGDPRGLEFLLKTFRAHPDQGLRRKILFHVGANPGPQTAGALRELLDGVKLDSKAERTALAEWLNLSGMSDDDPMLQRLVESAPVEERATARPGSSSRSGR